MKNGKDRNVYDVMNDVNVDIETMDMSDEEKDACVKRLRHKVKARKTGRNHGWKTAAAAVLVSGRRVKSAFRMECVR